MPRKAKVTEKPHPLFTVHWDWLTAAISLVLMTWMVTEGDWNLFGLTGHLEGFYDAQAVSLLHGRIDVERESLRGEAFVRDGKAYGYFGPTPALLRIPMVALFPEMNGLWSRLSMLLACVIMLGSLFLLLGTAEDQLPALREQRLWKAMRPVIVLAAAIGSTNFFIIAETKVYQESILWGGTLAFAHAACLARYLAKRDGRWLALSCGTAFFAFFARVSSGAGPIAALALVDLALILPIPRVRAYLSANDVPRRGQAIAAMSATVLATAFLWAGLNYWKFGVWFTSQPIALNQEYTPERLKNVHGELASLANIPLTLYTYLAPAHIEFATRFPWVFGVALEREALAARFPRAHLDRADVIASLPLSVPEFFFAALAGTALLLSTRGAGLRVLRAPLLGAAAGCGLMFCWGFLANRYLHDLFPWLVVGGSGALAWIASNARIPIRHAVAGAFAVATVYAMWTNFALGLLQQRWYAAPIPIEKQMAMLDLSSTTGLSGVVSYLTHWRGYIPASSFQGNLAVDPGAIPGRPDQPGARSAGPPPHRARYMISLPEDGLYELSIRYASAEPRPLVLFLNGQVAGHTCQTDTGGDTAEFLTWSFAGQHRLRRGTMTLDLASKGEFPLLHALRLVRVD